jgi:dihydropteroate synthase
MGAINLTSNSFYKGSVRNTTEDALQIAMKMESDGADIIDLGARSTAPYRTLDVSVEKEKRLLSESISAISKKVTVPISVDTTRLEPAKEAFRQGASILNDVYGLTQKDGLGLGKLVFSKEGSLILTAHEVRSKIRLNSPVERVTSCLKNSLDLAIKCGVNRSRICIDPGIGFFNDSKLSNIEWNCAIISDLRKLRSFGLNICVGLSRKKFLGQLLGGRPPESRLVGSLSATAISVYNGAHLIRTHDVSETVEAVKVARAIREKGLIPEMN